MSQLTPTEEQRAVIDAVLEGKSIFLTGSGGTGKSFLLNTLYHEFQRTGRKMTVTAMTGCAALLLGSHAKTLHSWAGIGLGKGSIDQMVTDIVMNGRKKKNWRDTDCLVIDEVSMLHPQLLEILDAIARRVRKNTQTPMGGLQLVFVGDFHQLPPIVKGAEEVGFAFQSRTWNSIVNKNFELKTIHRQADPVFQEILHEARHGSLSEASYSKLLERKGLSLKGLQIRPTLLFTRNDNVNELNAQHLQKLAGEPTIFKAKTIVGRPSNTKEKQAKVTDFFVGMKPVIPQADVDAATLRLDKDAPYEVELSLKVGAQVMLIVNKDQEAGLVNGSRGVVTGFTMAGLPRVKFLRDPEPITVDFHEWEAEGGNIVRAQIPLRLAYALTIHKAQGASLDSALVDIGRATFEYGQAYVALSRVRCLEGLFVYDVDPIAFRVHPAVKAFYAGIASAAASSDIQEQLLSA